MHRDHQEFINGLQGKHKIRLKFYSKSGDYPSERVVAPLDYGPSKRLKEKAPRYHFWDYARQHVISLDGSQIFSMTELSDVFDPFEFFVPAATAKQEKS